MSELFEHLSFRRSACFSDCRKFRYSLTRKWDDGLPRVVFILLNPSTADAKKDDPTNRRGLDFSRRWGYGSCVFVNLFGFRTKHPPILKTAADPIGPDNDRNILAECARADMIVCGWGCDGAWLGRDIAVLKILPRPLFCLGLTKDGHPWHPLYLKKKTALEAYGETK